MKIFFAEPAEIFANRCWPMIYKNKNIFNKMLTGTFFFFVILCPVNSTLMFIVCRVVAGERCLEGERLEKRTREGHGGNGCAANEVIMGKIASVVGFLIISVAFTTAAHGQPLTLTVTPSMGANNQVIVLAGTQVSIQASLATHNLPWYEGPPWLQIEGSAGTVSGYQNLFYLLCTYVEQRNEIGHSRVTITGSGMDEVTIDIY